MRLSISSGVGRQEPLRRVPQLAAAIEAAGFDRLWYVDYQLPMKDAVVAMTLAAEATSRIQIGPGVANPRTRHVSVLANAMNAIHEVSDGRAIVGLGAGHSAVYGVGMRPANIAEMRAATTDLRTLLAGGEVSLGGGEGYRVETAAVTPPPPILVAATHPRMLQLAGELADGVILMGAADVDVTTWQLDQIAAGAARSGRTLADLDVDLWAALSMSDDEQEAIEDVKAWAASEARVLATWKGELPGSLADFSDELLRAERDYVMSEHLSVRGPNGKLVSDELAQKLAIAGNAESCANRIKALGALGISGVTVSLLSGGREERIARLGAELVPRFRVAA